MLKLKRILLVCAVVSLCIAVAVKGQDAPAGRGEMGMGGAAPGARGAAAVGRGMRGMFGGRGGVTSPEIADDNKVTFRISAPQANAVSVSGDWGGMGGQGVQMTKDPNGLWSVTVGPLESELYGYTFNIDGAQVWDPANNQLKRDGTRITSVLIIPGEKGDLYSIQDVPHGTLSKVWYDSPTLNLHRRMYVYTPPGYEGGTERYPVLYLLHGGGGDEDAWTSLGHTPQILDNLIAAGRAKPMIVVMTNGNANQTAAPDVRSAGASQARGGVMGAIGAARGDAPARGEMPARGEGRGAAAPGGERGAAPAGERGARGGGIGGGAFPDSLAKDVVPFIEKSYRVLTGKQNRAVSGLSMGGGHTIAVSTSNPNMFDYIGVMSMGSDAEEQFTALREANPKLFWVGCGESDFLIERAKSLVQILEKLEFNYTFYENTGGHTWTNWRIYLSEFAPLLFK